MSAASVPPAWLWGAPLRIPPNLRPHIAFKVTVFNCIARILYCLPQARYDSDKVGPRQLISLITDLGYTAQPADDAGHVDGAALREKEKRVRRCGHVEWP